MSSSVAKHNSSIQYCVVRILMLLILHSLLTVNTVNVYHENFRKTDTRNIKTFSTTRCTYAKHHQILCPSNSQKRTLPVRSRLFDKQQMTMGKLLRMYAF